MDRRWALALTVFGLVLLITFVASDPGSQADTFQVASLDIVINEVAWGGTAAGSADEWIELYNNTNALIPIYGWTLKAADGQPAIALSGKIPARGYYLLERTDDCTVNDRTADQFYSHGLSNEGEGLELRDGSLVLIDSIAASGGWPAGSGSPGYHSMERIDPTAPGSPANWAGHNGLLSTGLDCSGMPLNGTPKARNSVSYADLRVAKVGPSAILPGEAITYTLVLSNQGQLPASDVWLTDVLPLGIAFVGQDSAFAFGRPYSRTLVWDVGPVGTETAGLPLTLTVTGRVAEGVWGELANVVTATSATTESQPADNQASAMTFVGQPITPVVVIESVYARTYDGIYDEALRLMNVSTITARIAGWSIGDGEGTATFPPGASLGPGQSIWCSRDAGAFAASFGFPPDYEWSGSSETVPSLAYAGSLRFTDAGDEALLIDAGGRVVDLLVYGEGQSLPGVWQGPTLLPYQPTTTFPGVGQILYRKRDQATGWPLPDTGTAADWAQDPADALYGRKVLYPGWDLDAFAMPAKVTETAVLTIAVGPDHLLDALLAQIESAQDSIWIEAYTFKSRPLAQALLDKLAAGVSVTLLLDGSPVGGTGDTQGWICAQILAAGGHVYFLSSARLQARYRCQHAKVMLIDDRLALIGSENLNADSMPTSARRGHTVGRRGVYLITDAPGVVERLRAVMQADIDPAHHKDIITCAQLPDLCTGTPPPSESTRVSYTVAFPSPLTIHGEFTFEVVQSPENALRTKYSLIGLVARAGQGDTVLVQQFYERTHWGAAGSTPEEHPNLRLLAYLDAARSGAQVHILLDGHLEEEANKETIAYLRDIALREGLNLEARLGNPTHLGIHNKMVLVQAGGQGYVHVGSINGSEVSSKANREMALQVTSDEAYAYLKSVFDHDWRTAKAYVYLPLVGREYRLPRPVNHVLISEIYYPSDPELQWVELHNPTGQAVDLGGFKIGDAANPGDHEGMYRFPTDTTLGPEQYLVVAVDAALFVQEFPGREPDYALLDSALNVPTLTKETEWSVGSWWLRQSGDQVLLLDRNNRTVDAVVYGDSLYPGTVAHPGVDPGHSLERFPVWLDRDDCRLDMRGAAEPSPGAGPQAAVWYNGPP